MADRVVHSYTVPYWRLELRAQESSLSRWMGKPVLRNLRFQIYRMVGDRQAELVLRGDRALLEQFYQVTEDYVRSDLHSSFPSPSPASPRQGLAHPSPPNPTLSMPAEPTQSATQSGTQSDRLSTSRSGQSGLLSLPSPNPTSNLTSNPLDPPSNDITLQWHPLGLLKHQLHYQPSDLGLPPQQWRFSTLELFDLLEVLDSWDQATVSLPAIRDKTLRPAEVPSETWATPTLAPAWTRVAASLVAAIGLTGGGIYLLSQGAAQIARQTLPQQVASAPNAPNAQSESARVGTTGANFGTGLPGVPNGAPTAQPTRGPRQTVLPPSSESPPIGPSTRPNSPTIASGNIGSTAASSAASAASSTGSSQSISPNATGLSAESNPAAAKASAAGQASTSNSTSLSIPAPSQPVANGQAIPQTADQAPVATSSADLIAAAPTTPKAPPPPISAPAALRQSALPAEAQADAEAAGALDRAAVLPSEARRQELGPVREVVVRKPLAPTPQVGEVQRYFQQRWQGLPNVPQPLQYRLGINPDGTLKSVTPLSNAAGLMVDRTGIPVVGEPFTGAASDGTSATVVITLRANGKTDVTLEKLTPPPTAPAPASTP